MSDFESRDVFLEAQRLYAEALDRRDQIRAEWEALESPVLARGSTGQLVEHPLVKMLREHDLAIARLGEAVRKRHRGPEPGAVLRGVGRSSSSKLRLTEKAS